MDTAYDHQLASERETEIKTATAWCIKNYPHRLPFLNEIYKILIQEYESYSKCGIYKSLKDYINELKPEHKLTSKQALRVLECYLRQELNTRQAWKIKNEPFNPAILKLEEIEEKLKRNSIHRFSVQLNHKRSLPEEL